MLRVPDREANIDLIQFHTPTDEKGIGRSLADTLGIRRIAFAVEDIEAIVTKLKKKGVEFFSGIQEYEESYKLCLCRGRKGIILELDEQI